MTSKVADKIADARSAADAARVVAKHAKRRADAAAALVARLGDDVVALAPRLEQLGGLYATALEVIHALDAKVVLLEGRLAQLEQLAALQGRAP